MADKRIDELEEASSITANDLFVIEQANTAKKLSGQTMTNFLTALADAHGGISSIEKTGSAGLNPVVDTYTITYADESTATFDVTNGVMGPTGQTGPKGDKGDSTTITSTSINYQVGNSGTSVPTGTWIQTVPNVPQGEYLWTRIITNYSDGTGVTSYSVARMGVDGTGAVSTVNNVSPDGMGNVALTASDIGALPDSYTPPVTSVNNKTGTVALTASDVGAVPATGGTFSGDVAFSEDVAVTGDFSGGGVVKSVNSVTPNASGEVSLEISDICSNTRIPANTTYTFNIANNTRNVFFVEGAGGQDALCIVLASVTSNTGSVYYNKIGTASDVTVTKAINSISFKSTNYTLSILRMVFTY